MIVSSLVTNRSLISSDSACLTLVIIKSFSTF
jgi:hypothetical protein